MLSELHSLNLKLCSKHSTINKFVLHLIVVPQLCSGWQHKYSTKTRQAGQANEQSMYPLMSMPLIFKFLRDFLFRYQLGIFLDVLAITCIIPESIVKKLCTKIFDQKYASLLLLIDRIQN